LDGSAIEGEERPEVDSNARVDWIIGVEEEFDDGS
jgi:hypothetical protein